MTAILLTVLAAVVGAEGVPAASEIMDKALKAVAPAQEYVAHVKQTIAAPNAEPVVRECDMKWVPEKGFVSQDKSEEPSATAQLNVTQFLKGVRDWPGIEVAEKEADGKKTYVLTGTDTQKGVDLAMTVTADHCLPISIVLTRQGSAYVDLTVEYQAAGDSWLPKKMVVDQKREGVKISQEFGEFTAVAAEAPKN